MRIGSQADAAFLASVVAEMGGVDIVLDDGSHVGRHIRASLDTLFPMLTTDGLYLIEDVHSAYNGRYDGRFSRHNFMRLLARLTDDMHHWYHAGGQRIAATADHLTGLHIYDSLVVLEKGAKMPPQHIQVGRTSHEKTSARVSGGKTRAEAQP